jgi:DNA sulfur modification protein DndB
MGDRGYFITAMTFGEVAQRIKGISEVHSSKKLSQWIQRQLDHLHSAEIAKYLTDNDDRFFSAMVIGVYGGDPQWAELTVGDPRNELSEEDEDRVNRTVGVLSLNGKEKLFAVDGQHRVSGIKSALEVDEALAKEEVAVILIGHARTSLGLTRTRQLFVTLNKRAKRVSPRDIVALDEDNGLAVVTRRLIDEYALFGKDGYVSFSGSVNLGSAEPKAITSVLGLFQLVKGLYPRDGKKWPKLKSVQDIRPSEEALVAMFDHNTKYWETLIAVVPEYKSVLEEEKRTCDYYRGGKHNHLLFRPLGQLAFARAVEFLIAKGKSMEKAVELLHSKNIMQLTDKVWHNILWNPVSEVMMTNWSAAQTLLLLTAGETGVTAAAKKRLKKLQEAPAE